MYLFETKEVEEFMGLTESYRKICYLTMKNIIFKAVLFSFVFFLPFFIAFTVILELMVCLPIFIFLIIPSITKITILLKILIYHLYLIHPHYRPLHLPHFLHLLNYEETPIPTLHLHPSQ